MIGPLDALGEAFLQIDVPTMDGPGHFAFFVPTSETYRRWPHYPFAARPETGRVGGGRGLTVSACRASGLGEAIEIASCCAWPDERLVSARIGDVKEQALTPGALLGFSATQQEHRDAWNAAYRDLDWCPPPASDSSALTWCKARHAATGAEVLVPSDYVLIGARSAGDERAVAIATSSGCAAGPTIEAARLSAALELIERDAVGRWWFGARNRPRLDAASFDLPGELQSHLRDRRRRTYLFDISTDLWSPVFAAASWEPDGTRVAMGFAARDREIDCALGALLEMLQIELGIGQRLRRSEPDILTWCREVTSALPPLSFRSTVKAIRAPVKEEASDALARLLAAVARNGLDLYFIDRTRPEFDVPVVRAIAPGLCSDKPRWGSRRLLAADGNDIEPVSIRDDGLPPNSLVLRV